MLKQSLFDVSAIIVIGTKIKRGGDTIGRLVSLRRSVGKTEWTQRDRL